MFYLQIPLAGYGGRSVLTLSGACLTNYNQRWLELGPLSVGHNIMQDIVLTNSGVRAAFIKASSFYGLHNIFLFLTIVFVDHMLNRLFVMLASETIEE